MLRRTDSSYFVGNEVAEILANDDEEVGMIDVSTCTRPGDCTRTTQVI